MQIHDLVNNPVAVQGFQAQVAKEGDAQNSVAPGAFITPQSIITFPFASGLVTAFWKGAQSLFPNWGSSPWVPLLIAFLVGFLIWLICTTDNRLNLTGRQKAIAFGIAFLNCFYLFVTALGLTSK